MWHRSRVIWEYFSIYDENNYLVVEKDWAAGLQLILVHKAQDGDVVLATHTIHSKVSF